MNAEDNMLWMGDLDDLMDSDFVTEAFRLMGETATSVKLVGDKRGGGRGRYGFVQFTDGEAARRTMLNVNGKTVANSTSDPPMLFNLSFANSPSVPSVEHNLFVNNIPPSLSDADLYLVFGEKYISCRGAKVYRTPAGESKGAGFVRFADQTDQQRALVEMHKHQVGDCQIMLKLAQARHRGPRQDTGPTPNYFQSPQMQHGYAGGGPPPQPLYAQQQQWGGAPPPPHIVLVNGNAPQQQHGYAGGGGGMMPPPYQQQQDDGRHYHNRERERSPPRHGGRFGRRSPPSRHRRHESSRPHRIVESPAVYDLAAVYDSDPDDVGVHEDLQTEAHHNGTVGNTDLYNKRFVVQANGMARALDVLYYNSKLINATIVLGDILGEVTVPPPDEEQKEEEEVVVKAELEDVSVGDTNSVQHTS